MHITVVSHCEPKDRVSNERATRTELLKIEGVTIGFLHRPDHQDVIDMIKKKKSDILIFDKSPGSFVEKTTKSVTKKFNGSSPRFMIHAGERVAGIQKINDFGEVRLLQTA